MNGTMLAEATPPASERLNRAQKAAVILCLLEKDGAPLLKDLGEASIRTFVRVMSQIDRVDEDTVRTVVGEFLSHLEHRGEAVQCGTKAALEIIENNLGPAAAARISENVSMVSAENVWKRIAMITPEVVSGYLEREHPQAAAVVLSKLPPEFAGGVMNGIEPEQARQIVQYFRTMRGIASHSADIIGKALGNALVSDRMKAQALTPAERMGAIMNYASSDVREGLIEHLGALDPLFAEAVKRSMFTFADVEARVQRGDVAKIVRAVDSDVLVKALAGDGPGTESVRNFILSNISNRMGEMIRDEIEQFGQIKRKDSEKAQSEIIKAIVALESAREIELITEDEKD